MADRRPLVLVVEDEVAISMMLEDVMDEEGYAVAGPFATCGGALDWLASETPPQCAILDTVLLDGSCRELAAELNRRNIPFVVFSGTPRATNTIPELAEARWIDKPALLQTVLDALGEMTQPIRRHG